MNSRINSMEIQLKNLEAKLEYAQEQAQVLTGEIEQMDAEMRFEQSDVEYRRMKNLRDRLVANRRKLNREIADLATEAENLSNDILAATRAEELRRKVRVAPKARLQNGKSIAMFTKLDENTVYLQTNWTEARKLAAWAAREVWNNLRDQGFQPVNEFDRVKCCKAA